MLRNYTQVRCSGCGLIYLNPRPTGISVQESHKQAGYDPFLSIREAKGILETGFVLARRITLKWKSRLIRRLLPCSGRILDVGCGTGEFIAILKDDYSVTGVEPEPEAARWARDRLGLYVFTGDLSVLPKSEPAFDLVSLWHVLEHLPDPRQTLVEICWRLKPGGTMLIAMPNIAAFDARIYREYWVALDPPRHLWHFDQSHLDALATATGFEMVRSGMLPLDLFYNVIWSEKLYWQVKSGLARCLTAIRAPITTLLSLILGTATGRHSGKYYVFRKLDQV
jgi:SAM-dependent methyltransferase